MNKNIHGLLQDWFILAFFSRELYLLYKNIGKITTIMKIGIDARLWNQTGVGRYIRNLVLNLTEIDNKNSYVLFVGKEDEKDINVTSPNWKIVIADIRWHSLKEQLEFPKILNKENLDLLHFPYFSVPVFYKKPFVVTIHDLIMHHFPTGKASTLPLPLYEIKNLGYQKVINHAVRDSNKLIVPSSFVKEDLINSFNVSSEKIFVTYEGVDEKILSKWLGKNIYGKYFLYVGNAYPHKNLEKLIEAFKNFQKENKETKLLLVGKDDYFYKKIEENLKEDSSIIFLHNVSDETLSNLYKNAIALVSVSLMEGFGLPVLEAMSQKCLVVCSDIPAFKEVAKDFAIYLDPKNLIDIEKALNNAYFKKFEAKIIEKAYNRSLEFSWKKAALKTLEVYTSASSV
ncbi:MAG TPA: glycosyltransferase family 1 protein [Candidatus Sulfotelmatobacter sp.]|nr:glycosyltransferase family 1 protein [Candidatus Sulfotelmatobacter sp.]